MQGEKTSWAVGNGVLRVLLGGREQPLPAELGYGGATRAWSVANAGGAAGVLVGLGSVCGRELARQLAVSLAHVGRPLPPFHPQTSPICCSCIYTPSNF